MDAFFRFASESPILTFFLFFILFGSLTDIIGHIASIFKRR